MKKDYNKKHKINHAKTSQKKLLDAIINIWSSESYKVKLLQMPS